MLVCFGDLLSFGLDGGVGWSVGGGVVGAFDWWWMITGVDGLWWMRGTVGGRRWLFCDAAAGAGADALPLLFCTGNLLRNSVA